MKSHYLFSSYALAILDEWLRHDSVLLAFDYDGTLVPIYQSPEGEVAPPWLADCLTQMAVNDPVVVVSGRGRADLERKLHVNNPKIMLIGNHGIEGVVPNDALLERCQKSIQSALSVLHVKKSSWLPGVEIEEKKYSLSIHYRNTSDPSVAQMQIESTVSQLPEEYRVMSGKFVINLLPADAPNKGSALIELMDYLGVSRAIYVGDDVTDEDVFKLKDDRIFSIHVGKGTTPMTAAPYYLKNQSEIKQLLEYILYRVD